MFRSDLDARLASWIFYGAIEEILTGWVLGRLPDGDEDVVQAEQTVVDVVCDGSGGPVTTRRGLVWILGLGAFGLAFSITTTAAYLPPLLEKFTDSNTMIAAVLGRGGRHSRSRSRS